MSKESRIPKTHRWADIKAARFAPEQMDRIDKAVASESARLTLQAIRKQLGLSQSAIAKLSGLGQSEVSRIEQRDDHMVSTLRRIVKALGGELEIHARFPDGRDVRLVTSSVEGASSENDSVTKGRGQGGPLSRRIPRRSARVGGVSSPKRASKTR